MQLRAPLQDTTHMPLGGRLGIDRVSVRFGETLALSELSLDIAPGAFVALLGPSGCGKSTLLNAIAGFQPVTSGKIDVDGAPTKGPGADRGVVFQQPWLFPWMTVRENIAYGPRMRGLPRAEIEARADALIKVVGLAAAARRYPHQLSGGMQQRTAIARVLANDPAVLLMDEPFAALDAQTRSMMQAYLLEVWSKLPKTIVFVTHDIDEAVFLGDRVLVMSASPGRIIADIKIDLPRPRDGDLTVDEGFIRYKRLFHTQIRQESLKAFEQQNR